MYMGELMKARFSEKNETLSAAGHGRTCPVLSSAVSEGHSFFISQGTVSEKVCGFCQLRRSAWQSVFQAGTKEYAPYDRDMRTGLSAFIVTFDDIFGEYR